MAMEEEDDDKRYVEVTEMVVEDEHRESKFRIMIKHQSSAEEVFKSYTKAKRTTFPCQTFIGTDDQLTKVSVSRSQKSPPSSFRVLELEDQRKSVIGLSISKGLKLTCKLGRRMTAIEVAECRVQQSLSALATKAGLMECIKTGTENLKLFLSLGLSAAELTAISKSVGLVLAEIFARIENISNKFTGLRSLVLDLAEQLTCVQEEKRHFDTVIARRELDNLIELTIKCAMQISSYYSQSKLAVFAKELWSSDKERFEDLRQELEQQKERILRAFLTDVRVGISDVSRKVDNVNRAESLKSHAKEEKLLAKLLPPDESLHRGKPQCLAGTRSSVLDFIEHWCDEHTAWSRLFWLYGVAGSGKSSVAASICQRIGRRLAGSFFCKRDQEERRNPVRFIWTLAFYLAKTNPVYRERLLGALREPDVFVNKDIESQFNLLLKEPLESMAQCCNVTQAIFVVDALDECEQNGAVAHLIGRVIELVPWMRFVVTSRDTADIRSGIDALSLSYDSYDLFTDDAREDIRAYVLHEIGPNGRLVDIAPFLEPSAVDTLVSNSQGLFIWIRTVIEYIIGTEIGKLEVMEWILHSNVHAEAETSLDALYRAVLMDAAGTSDTGKILVQLIIGYILAASTIAPLTQDILYAFLPPAMPIVRGEFDSVFKKLSAILIIDNGLIKVFHASLLDFIATKSRCEEIFFRDRAVFDSLMAAGCLEIMTNGTRNRKRHPTSLGGLRFNICDLPSSYLPNSEVEDLDLRVKKYISPELAYSCSHWISFVKCALYERDHEVSLDDFNVPQQTELLKAVELVCSEKALYWLEVMSLTSKLGEARSSLAGFSPPREISLPLSLRHVVGDLALHLDRQFNMIQHSAPHIYVSGLNWISPVSPFWSNAFSDARILSCSLNGHSPLLQQFFHPVAPEAVWKIIISPDASSMATAAYRGILCIWDMGSGSLIKSGRIFTQVDSTKSNWSDAFALTYSQSGHHIASSRYSPLIEIWDAKSLCRSREPLRGHTASVQSLVYSPKMDLLVSGSEDGTIRLWCSSTYTTMSIINDHKSPYRAMSLSPDGTYIASTGRGHTLYLWNTRDGSLVGEGRGHSESISDIAFSFDGKHIASGSRDKTVRIWDASTMQPLCKPLIHDDELLGISWTPIGTEPECILASYEREYLQAWKWSSSLKRTEDPVSLSLVARNFLFSDEGTRIVAYDAYQRELNAYRWDFSALRSRDVSYRTESHEVHSLRYSQDGSSILAAKWQESVDIWNSSGKPTSPISIPQGFCFLAFSPDVQFSVYVSETDILFQPLHASTTPRMYTLPSDDIFSCAAFIPNSSRLALGGNNGTLRFWDIESMQPIGEDLRIHGECITSLAPTRDGKLIACCWKDAWLAVCDAETGAVIYESYEESESQFMVIAHSPQASHIATSDMYMSIHVRDTGSLSAGKTTFTGHEGFITSIAFSPDSKRMYSAAKDSTLRCWDVGSGAQIGRTLSIDPGYKAYFCSLTVSPDGSQIAGGRIDGTVRLVEEQAFFWESDTTLCAEGLLGPGKVPASIGEDGWLRTTEGDLLFWIAAEFRNAVLDSSTMYLSGYDSDQPIRINWERLYHGANWNEIYSEV